MAWAKLNATDYKNCLAQIVAFSTKAFGAGSITAGGGNTGDGVLYGASATANSVAETWTATGDLGGADGVATFTVAGSFSGPQVGAVSGEPYSIDECSFIMLNGSADWVIADSYTFVVAAITPEWSVNESDLISTQQYAMLQGIGSGADEIFVGLRTQSDESTYFNLELSGFSGYVNGNTYDDQNGIRSYYTCLSSVGFDFWIFTTSRCIKIVPVIGTIYGGGYTGWFLPNASPSQYAYPQFVGGSTDDVAQLVGGTEDDHTNYWASFDGELSGAVNDGNSWVEINQFIPRSFWDSQLSWFPDLDGNRTTYPCEALKTSTKNIYGRLEGVHYAVNGDSVLTPEDIINDGNKCFIIFQDTFRTGTISVIAIDLIGDA